MPSMSGTSPSPPRFNESIDEEVKVSRCSSSSSSSLSSSSSSEAPSPSPSPPPPETTAETTSSSESSASAATSETDTPPLNRVFYCKLPPNTNSHIEVYDNCFCPPIIVNDHNRTNFLLFYPPF